MKIALFDASSNYWQLGHYEADVCPAPGQQITLYDEQLAGEYRVLEVIHSGHGMQLRTSLHVAPEALAERYLPGSQSDRVPLILSALIFALCVIAGAMLEWRWG